MTSDTPRSALPARWPAFWPALSKDPVLLLGAVVATVCFAWMLIHIGDRSLWFDELFTAAIASPQTSDAAAVAMVRSDVHLPLHFFALRAWAGLFGNASELTLRLFNLLPFAFAVAAAVMGLRRDASSPKPLWMALFFTAFGTLWFLQESRMYALMIMQAFCGTLAVLESRLRPKLDAGYIAMLLVTFIVLPLGHWFSFAYAGLLLTGLLAAAAFERQWKTAALYFCLGAVLALLGGAWILSNFGSTVGSVGGYGGHVLGGSMSGWALKSSATGALLYALTLNPILIGACAFGMWTVARSARKQIPELIILVSTLFLICAILGVSVVSPMFQPRNFLWAIAPFTLFAAIGLERIFAMVRWSDLRRTGALAGILATNLGIATFAPIEDQLPLDDWRAAGQTIAAIPACKDQPLPVTVQWGDRSSATDIENATAMYAYYAGGRERMVPVFNGETVPLDTSRACPAALWVAQMKDEEAKHVARLILGEGADDLTVTRFRGNSIFMRPATRSD